MDIDEAYREVTNLVLQGLGISEAIEFIGFSEHKFYRYLNTQQRLELQQVKTLNTMYGVASLDNRSIDLYLKAFEAHKYYNYPDYEEI
jgi:hypothetical protein